MPLDHFICENCGKNFTYNVTNELGIFQVICPYCNSMRELNITRFTLEFRNMVKIIKSGENFIVPDPNNR